MWENFKLSEPYRLAMFWDQYATTEIAWTQAERLEELKRESASSFAECSCRRTWSKLIF